MTAERGMHQNSSTGGAGRSTVVGVFDDRDHAEMAVRDLQSAGFNENQIGFAMRDSGGSGSGSHGSGEVTTDTGPGSGALTGLTTGGLIGGVLGALASLAIPGVGPVVAAGILGPILGGAAAGAGIGAVGGGLVGGLVTTGVPEDEARIYDEEFRAGSAIVTVRADNRYAEAESILRRHGGKFAQGGSSAGSSAAPGASTQAAGFANTQNRETTQTANNQGEIRVPEVEERLHVEKRQAEMGEVRVHKEVEVEQQTIPVELQREEVHVERREVAARPLQAGEDAFQEGTIRVPVRGEEAVVTKEAVVTGEVVVNKDRHVEREQVTDTVRRTEVHVDDESQTRTDNDTRTDTRTDTTRRNT